MKQNSASAHPIEGHPLAEISEEYTKNLYIDMLCVIAEYENEDAANQHKFIQRIMSGAGMTEPVTEHIKNAMELSEERFGEFLGQVKEYSLCDIFVIDSLIIACGNGKPNTKQVEFLAEIMDALKINSDRAGYLAELANAVLEQDSDKYSEASGKIPHDEHNVIIPNIVCYLKGFVTGILVDTDELLWVYAKNKTELDMSEYLEECKNELKRKNIVIENIVFNSENIRITSSENITMTNCEFHEGKLSFEGCGDISISRCLFKDMSDSAITAKAIHTLTIESDKFNNCGRTTSGDDTGGAIRVCDVKKLILINSEFGTI